MAVKLRLARHGSKKRPYYRIVAANADAKRDGRYLEAVGSYEPLLDPPSVTLKRERVNYWLGEGAQPTSTVKNILNRFMQAEDVSSHGRRKAGAEALEAQTAKVEKAAIEKAAAEKAAADKAAAEKAVADKAAAEKAAADKAAADKAAADEAPAEEAKADEAPAEEAKADEAPAEEAKADEAKAEAAVADDEKKEDSE
jgi:small subunit ribosomal protein S16